MTTLRSKKEFKNLIDYGVKKATFFFGKTKSELFGGSIFARYSKVAAFEGGRGVIVIIMGGVR